MPRTFKNVQWQRVAEIGIAAEYLAPLFTEDASPKSAMLLYLAPADYHRFHAPVDGTLVSVFPEANGPGFQAVLDGFPHSVSVKDYIFSSVNILARNRRVALVFEIGAGTHMAMVVVGGITVDSIRMATWRSERRCGAGSASAGSRAVGASSPSSSAARCWSRSGTKRRGFWPRRMKAAGRSGCSRSSAATALGALWRRTADGRVDAFVIRNHFSVSAKCDSHFSLSFSTSVSLKEPWSVDRPAVRFSHI